MSKAWYTIKKHKSNEGVLWYHIVEAKDTFKLDVSLVDRYKRLLNDLNMVREDLYLLIDDNTIRVQEFFDKVEEVSRLSRELSELEKQIDQELEEQGYGQK